MIEVEHIDVNIVLHCTNRCIGCSHASPFAEPYSMGLMTMASDLCALEPILKAKRIQIVGGEPLLHPRIAAFIHLARNFSDTVVITNGKLLKAAHESFWSALQALQISVYADLDLSNVDFAKQKQEQYGFTLDVQEIKEFYRQFTFPPTDGVESFSKCTWKTNCFTVHEGFFYLCPQTAFFTPRFLKAESDGLPLAEITEEKLAAFMSRDKPFKACTVCRGYTETMPWRQADTEAQWIAESTIR